MEVRRLKKILTDVRMVICVMINFQIYRMIKYSREKVLKESDALQS